MNASVVHILTHSSSGVSHSAHRSIKALNSTFTTLSTALPRGYYYYLYIYKSRFQADRFHIRFPLLTKHLHGSEGYGVKFTVDQNSLTDGVNWVSRSLSTRPIKTELLGIKIDATGDEVILKRF